MSRCGAGRRDAVSSALPQKVLAHFPGTPGSRARIAVDTGAPCVLDSRRPASALRRAITALEALASRPERPELIADEVDRRHEHDRYRLSDHLVEPGSDEHVKDDQVRTEREGRDDEESHALVRDVASLRPEGPDPVPGVVVRHCNEERAGRGRYVVDLDDEDEEREDPQVDRVAGRAKIP